MIFEHNLKTGRRRELVDISAVVEADLKNSGMIDGLCVVFVTHTTAALTINENADPAVPYDMLSKLAQMVPENENYSAQKIEGDMEFEVWGVVTNVIHEL